jgi:hypothetical protein
MNPSAGHKKKEDRLNLSALYEAKMSPFDDGSAEKFLKSVPSFLPGGQCKEEGRQTPDRGSKDKRDEVRIMKNLMTTDGTDD